MKIEIIVGYPNSCIAIDETRVTDAKLYGYGKVTRSFNVSKDKVAKLIDGKDVVTFHLLDGGRRGVFLEGERLTNNGAKEEYQTFLSRKNEELKLLKKSWSKKRANVYFDGSIVNVRAENIREILKYASRN